MRGMVRSRLFWGALGGVVIACFIPFVASDYILGVLIPAYYFAVFAMSWDLLFGFAGEVNFGPTFLVGLGAYGAGILDAQTGLPVPVCIAFGTLLAVLGGVLLALPALRLSGPYFGLITLVAVLLLQQMVTVFAGFTGGEIGLTIPDILFIDDNSNYYFALGFMTLSGLILFGLSRSAVGLILQACGQDKIEAQALGFNVTKHKLAAFCVSAAFSGMAGALLVFYYSTASPGTVIDLAVGVQVIIAAVLGGRRTILGAVLGAIFLVAAGEVLRPLGQLSTFVVSAFALVVILVVPAGFLGTLLHRRSRA
jgi:branched-chain amino acid transport system permease protein